MDSMKIGGFVSAAGGLDKAIPRAVENGFKVAMFFIGSPQGWNLPTLADEVVANYKAALKESDVASTYAHGLYLANLASPNKDLFNKSVAALTKTMQNGEAINLDGVIFHLGSHAGTNADEGLARVAKGVQQVLGNSPGKTRLILENSVGQGGKVGRSLAELGQVLDRLSASERSRVGVCYDTCHGFATGYNYVDKASFQQLLGDIDQYIGFEKLECFHVNDSKGALGSNIDRHANIGEGEIGLEGFKVFMNEPKFKDKNFILEVPGLNSLGPSKLDKEALESVIK